MRNSKEKVDCKDERIDELETQLTEYKRFAGSEFADIRGRITDVEEQVQTLESSPDNTTSEEADEVPSQTTETPLERICALPEQIADRELTTN